MQAERRWACTGTPINTDLRDLRGQLGALHAAPFMESGFANQFLKFGLGPYQAEVLLLMRQLMIRHSKRAVEKQGEWHLPAKTEELVPVRLSDSEWRLYERTHDQVRAAFESYARRGAASCQKHTLAIMALLMPLRRLCSGLLAVQAPPVEASPVGGYASDSESNGSCDPAPEDEELFCPPKEDVECSICMEAFEQPTRTPCGHWFCHECMISLMAWRLLASHLI